MPIRDVRTSGNFDSATKSLDNSIWQRLQKQIKKIVEDPEVGKPLRYDMKGERTIYVKPYRLIYRIDGETLFLLDFQHRKGVYR